jgi:hypothetical protein
VVLFLQYPSMVVHTGVAVGWFLVPARRGVEIPQAYFGVRVLLRMVSEAPSNSALVLAIVVLAEMHILPQARVFHMWVAR